MKIQSVKIHGFKRFTDLEIRDLPESTKLVVLVGPNGCGKTSLFEAFNHWYKWKGFNNAGDFTYCAKKGEIDTQKDRSWYQHVVDIKCYGHTFESQDKAVGKFYFRSAHRNEPDFSTTHLNKQSDLTKQIRLENLMTTDCCVSSNYQRIVSSTLAGVYDPSNDAKTVADLREELIGKIKISLNHVFPDLTLTSIGDPLQNGSFYFTKGVSKNFHYKNLSAGEKSAFDLILDMVVQMNSFTDTVFCIDEPETHMHTSLQSKLLAELYSLVPPEGQLWIATHSMGMLKTAKDLDLQHPGTIVFLDFSDKDFDDSVVLTPSKSDSTMWHKFLDLAFGDLSNLIAPQTVVFCEGSTQKGKSNNFDAKIYKKVFDENYPDTEFVSIGSCNDVENPDNVSMSIVRNLLHNSKIIKLVDRDDKSEEEVNECYSNGIKVLSRRHIECYLLDDEIICKLCKINHKEDKIEECLTLKQKELNSSISRGNPIDDVKSASGPITTGLKQILQLRCAGNSREAFLQHTIAPLITEDTSVYKDLAKDIFAE